jgi:adenylate kinase family enzyme
VERVLVVGTTGAGKTTIARRLSSALGAPHVELDSLFWLPNWVERDAEPFRALVADATSGDRWIADGNYLSRLGDLLWERADTIVWPDLPLRVIVPRLVVRTTSRSLRRSRLWNGNREKLSNLWNKDESLVRWAARVHGDHRAVYEERIGDARWSHIDVVRLRTRREVVRWLAAAARDVDRL